MVTTAVVRQFHEEDRSAVIAIWETTFPNDPGWNDPNRVIDTKLLVQPELFLVCEVDGVVVGTVIAGFDGFRGWIHHLAVEPGKQGLGLSHRMIEAAETGLRNLGCIKVNLQVRSDNRQAAEKYLKMGFNEEPRISMGKLLSYETGS